MYWARSYRKYILKITQPSQYGYAKLQYGFVVTSGSLSMVATQNPYFTYLAAEVQISLICRSWAIYNRNKYCFRNLKIRRRKIYVEMPQFNHQRDFPKLAKLI